MMTMMTALDPTAGSSTHYHSVDLDALIEKIKNLGLDDVKNMEQECTEEVRVLVAKSKEMCNHIKTEAKKEVSGINMHCQFKTMIYFNTTQV